MGTSSIVITSFTAAPTLRGNKLTAVVSASGPALNIPTLMLDTVEFYASTTNDFTTATKVVEGKSEALHAGLIEEQTYYYWAKPRAVNGNYGAVNPVSPTGGVVCTAVGQSGLAFGLANGKLVPTVATNALTIAIKTANGNDPSASDPVWVAFRNVTLAAGNYQIRQITAATSLVISSGSTLGALNATPFRIWIVLIDDAGTLRLAAQNCSSALASYALAEYGVINATAEGGAGAADSIGVAYAGAAVSAKPFRILGYLEWTSGLAAAGTWSAAPDGVQLFGPGIKKPGDIVQQALSRSSAVATGTTIIPFDDTIPLNTEGDQYFSTDITPTSPVNILQNEFFLRVSHPTSGATSPKLAAALFQDSGANALAVAWAWDLSGDFAVNLMGDYQQLALSPPPPTTFKVRAGAHVSGTTTLNGITGNRSYGGVMWSQHKVTEIMG